MTSDKDNYPRLVREKAAHGESGVKSSIGEGAVILRDEHQREIRLSWDKKGQAGETRALAPGIYTVVGYRAVKKSKDGTEWMITATSANFAKLIVKVGEIATVPVPKKILQSGRLLRHGSNSNVDMALTYGRGGVTIYKDGERIPMPFRVVDGSGKTVGTGNIEYG